MTNTTTQDLIESLRTGPAVTLATLEAAERLAQLNNELEAMRRRALKAESAASQAVAEINALNAKLQELTDLLRWRKQSEEPAPDSTKVITLTGRYVWLGMSSQLRPANYWRPIGQLPEVEVIESNRMECVTWLPETAV